MPDLTYESWKAQMARPVAKAIAAWRLPLSCTPLLPPPADPVWATPHTEEHLRELLERLPRKQAIVCATVAAEHVLPLWERWAYAPEASEVEPNDPAIVSSALVRVREWQRCQAAVGDVQQLMPALYRACWRPAGHTHGAMELPACEAARSVYQLCQAVIFHERTGADEVALAVLSAYYAWVFAYDEPMIWWDNADGRQWLTELWWSRCRARLAFADATTAELE